MSATPMTSAVSPARSARRDGRPTATGTYRLQVHRDYTFDDAAAEVPYLGRLGVSHLYLSPVLASVPGSAHGYDVLDHSQVDAERGGREGLERLATACHRHGLGLVVDIVPNHMALVAPQWRNAVVWEVLAGGRHAARAHWLDVDWTALDGQLGLPVLGHPVAEELRAGALVLDTGRPDEGPAAGEPVVRYYDHVLPVAGATTPQGWDGSPTSDAATVAGVLAHQHYRLAGWRERDRVLNYRRFFEVDQLVGIRVEEADVFEATHRLLLDLHHGGVIDGFRVDHPDGLADPQGYLAELARHCRPGTPIWVEKILEGEERLPDAWDCEGTTGYDANAALQVALVPPVTVTEVDLAWEHAGGEPVLGEVVAAAKREAVGRLLVPEVDRLLRRATEALPDHDEAALRNGLQQLLAAVDAYRCYVRPGHEADPDSRARLDEAIEQALANRGIALI
ncbi:alpha-amylase family glycosyl hydrolase, partial [Ornithinicoccus halotolerans]|uniref:alpha-amylase family glycosyl hydrolase n=1 Tax=Ornithinicoccus halotolerans TaxID=1748220 RepID=UPI00225E6D2F